MQQVSWTRSPVSAANTNRDGSGTMVEVATIAAGGEFLAKIVALPLGTNITSEATVLCSNGDGVANTKNTFLLGTETTPVTTLGSIDETTDRITWQLDIWLPEGFVIYAQVYDALAAGWQFVAFLHSDYRPEFTKAL